MQINFIAGLPRSGSTLLAALLKQNSDFYVTVCSPLCRIVANLLTTMSNSEVPWSVPLARRQHIFRSFVETFYDDAPASVIFDSNRGWCNILPAIAEVFPSAKVICCVRSPAWIIDSTERAVRRNPLHESRMFGNTALQTVYERAQQMTTTAFLGSSLHALRQAWFSEQAHHIIAVRYESLARRPAETMARLYQLLGQPAFAHDFNAVSHDEPEFDSFIGLPDLHRVRPPVQMRERETILPPDLFRKHDDPFWDMPGQNPRRVPII